MFAYAHARLDDEAIKLTRVLSGDEFFAFIRGFFGPKGLRNFITQYRSLSFKDLIYQGSALVYNDDILLMRTSKLHKLQLIKQLYHSADKVNLQLAPEKPFFMLLTVDYFGHERGLNTIKPIEHKSAAIQ